MVDSNKYGFVGLGDMGGPMAANVARGGFQLIVYDKAGTENRAPSGTELGIGIEDVAREAQIVFVAVPDAEASLDVARSLVAVEDRDTRTVINLSTVGVEATGSIEKTLADFGVDYVDAPVSGGRAGAIQGTVTVMWSGSAERMELIRPVLDSFAGSVFFVGPTPGQGQAMMVLIYYLNLPKIFTDFSLIMMDVRAEQVVEMRQPMDLLFQHQALLSLLSHLQVA